MAYKNQSQTLNIRFPGALHWTYLLTSKGFVYFYSAEDRIDLDDLSLKKGQIFCRQKKKHFYKAIFHQLKLLVPRIQQLMEFDDFRKENPKIDQYIEDFLPGHCKFNCLLA